MDFVSKEFDFRESSPCIVIGEIGINHNRNKETLFRLIDEGIDAGLDVIKLQRFNSSLEIAFNAPTADYQKNAGQGDNQLEMAKKYELPDEWLIEAFEYCKTRKVGFLCTAFEHESVDFIADRLGCKTIKVSSADINNKPLLEKIAKKFDYYLLSTGASYLEECSEALNWMRDVGAKEGNTALMHCTSQYPASIEQANLNAIVNMRSHFNLPTGYSDHTEGIVAAVVSASLGAAMIEKHYTLDKNMDGPDHKASADLDELAQLVKSVKQASASLGEGVKKPAEEEQETRQIIRKSAVCGIDNMTPGLQLESNMVEIKRPYVEGAIQPNEIELFIGRTIKNAKSIDEPLFKMDFNTE